MEMVDRDELLQKLDQMPEVLNWRASVGAIFIVSKAGSVQLSLQIHGALPRLQFVLVSITNSICTGWADNGTWDFVNNPRASK
jgi:hypothetical protein